MDIKSFFQEIGKFLVSLYQNYFALIILFIVVLVALILACMLFIYRRRKREKEEMKLVIKEAIASLTSEEIDNISKNVSNPKQFRAYIENETKPKTENQPTLDSTPTPQPLETPVLEEVAVTKTEDSTEPKVEEVKPAKKTRKSTPKQVEQVEEVKPKRQYLGKWKIKQDANGFYAKLHASNGGLLLKTEYYTSLSGVKNGIETIKRNVENGNFAVSIDKHNHYHFKLFSNSNKLICVSEDYSSKAKCDNGIESVKRFASSPNVILEEKDD